MKSFATETINSAVQKKKLNVILKLNKSKTLELPT